MSFVLVLFACTCLFTACGKKGLTDNPATDAEVIGNGGFAVVKGDYLYYVNGYVDDYVGTLRENPSLNKEGEVVFGGIYRTKLVGGKIQKDDNGFLSNTEQVVSQVVGFENGGFYILGDYIYYTTPHMNKDGSGTVRTDYTNICRINIDGTDSERLYVSKSASVQDWNVYEIEGEHYVVLVEKMSTEDTSTTPTNIVSIDEDGDVTTLAEDVSTYVLLDDNKIDQDYEEYVYYTFTNDDNENRIGKSHIESGDDDDYMLNNGDTYSLVDFKNGNLYLTIANDGTSLYRLDLSLNENLTNITPYGLTNGEFASYYVIDGVVNNVITVDSNNYMYYYVNGTANKLLLSTSVTFVGISDNCVYYLESEQLKRVSFVTGDIETFGAEGKAYLLSLAKQVDINGSRIFLFAQYEQEEKDADGNVVNNYYLNVIDIFADKQDSEFVGLFEEGHTPKEPTAEEKENGAVWVK